MIKCPNADCEWHGIDGCYQNIKLIELVNGGLRCLQYSPRVDCRDLNAPFKSNCTKQHGKYQSNGYKTVK